MDDLKKELKVLKSEREVSEKRTKLLNELAIEKKLKKERTAGFLRKIGKKIIKEIKIGLK